MITAESAQTLALQSEIANPITETQPKNGERNDNENKKLLYEGDKEFDSRGIDPRGGKMLINPLRTADQINRQQNNISDEDDQLGLVRLYGNGEWNRAPSRDPCNQRKNNAEDNEHDDGIGGLETFIAQKDGEGAGIKDQAADKDPVKGGLLGAFCGISILRVRCSARSPWIQTKNLNKRAAVRNSRNSLVKTQPASLLSQCACASKLSHLLLFVVNGYVLELFPFWRCAVQGDRAGFPIGRNDDLTGDRDLAIFLIGGCQCALIHLRVGTSI